MGYKRFGCVAKDYEVGHFFFHPYSFVSFCLVVTAEKCNEWLKRDKDTFKLNFYSLVYNNFVGRNVFPVSIKEPSVQSRRVKESTEEFFLAPGSSSFQACEDYPFYQTPPMILLIFVLIYFILRLFYFYSLCSCFYSFIYYSILTYSFQYFLYIYIYTYINFYKYFYNSGGVKKKQNLQFVN